MIAAVLAVLLAASSAPIELAPRAVLAQYAEALSELKEPPAMTFEYTIAQSGTRTIYETHRVYRMGDRVRDETVTQGGHNLTEAERRVASGKPFRYSIARLAPRPAEYAFAFQRADLTGRHWSYTFDTAARAPSDFTITQVTIDGLSFLPSSIAFTTIANGVKARGTLTFAKTDAYWMIQDANVEAKLEAGIASERLTFRNFQFPASLPAETFRS